MSTTSEYQLFLMPNPETRYSHQYFLSLTFEDMLLLNIVIRHCFRLDLLSIGSLIVQFLTLVKPRQFSLSSSFPLWWCSEYRCGDALCVCRIHVFGASHPLSSEEHCPSYCNLTLFEGMLLALLMARSIANQCNSSFGTSKRFSTMPYL